MSVTHGAHLPPPTDTRWTGRLVSASSVEFASASWGCRRPRPFSRVDDAARALSAPAGLDELDVGLASAETGLPARPAPRTNRATRGSFGMSWSPVGALRTPVTLTIRACLRRVS